MASIRELLGEAATKQILRAWEEADDHLADIQIAREKHIYDTGYDAVASCAFCAR